MDKLLLEMMRSGLPVLPVGSDKRPICFSHKFLDVRLPTDLDYQHINDCWYALKAGNQQTAIECIDFDCKHLPPPLRADMWARYVAENYIEDLVVQSTPSGGKHIIYRTTTPVPGSEKLAYHAASKEAFFETRGRGGYFLIHPSPGYTVDRGDLYSIPIITPDRADDLKASCRALNQRTKNITHPRQSPEIRAYNANHHQDVVEILLSQGWTINKEMSDRIYVRRPGKAAGTSGTIFKTSGYFYVFTTEVAGYDPSTAYTPFEIIGRAQGFDKQRMERVAFEESGTEYIRDVITEILRNPDKAKPVDIRALLSGTIIKNMEKIGKFYRDENSGYFFHDYKITRIDLHGDKFYYLMYDIYGLNKVDTLTRHVFEDVKNHAFTNGTQIIIHKYSHYNGQYVYITNFNGKMFRISDKEIDEVPNGTDGIIFLDTAGVPVELTDKHCDFNGLLFGQVGFEAGNITTPEYIQLFTLWIVSIFFLSYNKVIACTIGEKGSGKTVIFKKLLYMLYGNESGIKMVPEQSRDFWSAVTNNKIVIFDNVDTHRDWLNDALASCATGGTVSLRKLYTTNEEDTYHVDCFLGLTSRTPKFTRDDVADRLIIFPVERFTEFTPEDLIVKQILDNRDALMGYVFQTIKAAIPKMYLPDQMCVSRMAVFENFCHKMVPESKGVFYKMIENQKEFSEDAFTDLFLMYCQDQETGYIEKSSNELSNELNELAARKRMKNYTMSSNSVAYKIKRQFDFCKIEKVKAGHGNKSKYRITILCERKVAAF